MKPRPDIGSAVSQSLTRQDLQQSALSNSPGVSHIFSSRAAAQAGIAQLGDEASASHILAIEDDAIVIRASNATADPLFKGERPWGIEQRLDGGRRPGAMRKTLQASGVLRLVDVTGADRITASLPPVLAQLRIGAGTRLSFVAAATSTVPDPTITIAGVTRTIRDIDGTALRPGDLKAGRSYDLRVESPAEVRIVTPGLALKAAARLEAGAEVVAARTLLPTTGGGMHRTGPARFTPEFWALEMSRGLAGCPPPLALYPQTWSPGTAWLGKVGVEQPAAHTPLDTPWEKDGNVIHPCVVEFYHGFRGFRYLLGITGYPGRLEAYENPILYGSNDLRTWVLLPDMPQPLARTPALRPGENGHTSDIWLSHDPRTGNLIVGWRVTLRLDGPGSTPERIVNSLWFRESRDGYHWSPAQPMLEARGDEDGLLSPSLLFDPATCTWHLYSVHKPVLRHRTARSLTGPWSAAETITTPAGCRPHHLDVRWVGDRLVFLIYSMAEANLFFGTIADWRTWSFDETPVIADPTRGCYKASFLPEVEGDRLSFLVFWTTGAGRREAAPGPDYQLLIARSNAVTMDAPGLGDPEGPPPGRARRRAGGRRRKH